MKFGVLVDNFYASQQSFYLINYYNQAVKDYGHDITVFFETPVYPCVPVGFGVMQLNEAFGYKGPLIASSFNLAAKLLGCTGTDERYFYLWDLEWIRFEGKHFHQISQIYQNPKLRLIARSIEHKDIIEDCWNVKVAGIASNFNPEHFAGTINEQRLSK